MFLLPRAAHGRPRVLLFTFQSVRAEQEKKQKALVVALQQGWAGFESPRRPASSQLQLQACPPPTAPWSSGLGFPQLQLPSASEPLSVGESAQSTQAPASFHPQQPLRSALQVPSLCDCLKLEAISGLRTKFQPRSADSLTHCTECPSLHLETTRTSAVT